MTTPKNLLQGQSRAKPLNPISLVTLFDRQSNLNRQRRAMTSHPLIAEQMAKLHS
jgi:hypothetical protein